MTGKIGCSDMNETKTYDSCPLLLVLVANAVSVLIYALGAVIVVAMGWWAAALWGGGRVSSF